LANDNPTNDASLERPGCPLHGAAGFRTFEISFGDSCRKHAENGQKWRSLEHKGPLFPPEYEPLPSSVSFLYNGTPVILRPATEEVATFYAKMLDHEFTTKEVFQNNFFTDWKEVMTETERQLISDLSQCDFSNIHKYFVEKTEEKRNMTKEEKQVLKEEANKLTEEYGYCLLDGHREKIGNFRVEPPGLFRGRGEHPKMGKLKKRVQPEDVIINCSKDVKIPEPPPGHRWKKVQHDNTVTWLASWVENIHGHIKYIMLNPSSKLKGEKDWQKYETARKLKLSVDSIRSEYQSAWTSCEMKQRQYGVALYFIDKLALRAGNEKDDDTADTVGCCSLRVEHINLHRHLDSLDYVVEFDFLGKDSIRYYNKVPVEKQVYKNLKLFMNSKNPDDDLFDRISTTYLNKKLNEAMPGLTAKVFRTFNASTTLQEQLNQLTTDDMTLPEKILAYNRANRAVAILCNHQRAAPKTFEKSMQLLQEKIKKKQEEVEKAKKELKQAKKEHKQLPSEVSKKLVQKMEKTVKRLLEQLKKLQLLETDRNENKVIALGTSKLNYLDPRISVAWYSTTHTRIHLTHYTLPLYCLRSVLQNNARRPCFVLFFQTWHYFSILNIT
uniref:DNA topoisomerase I n=1 Tax=Pygocentrus nattereri TaxID=42514 RepID=A0AAR2K6W8_PYGNA